MEFSEATASYFRHAADAERSEITAALKKFERYKKRPGSIPADQALTFYSGADKMSLADPAAINRRLENRGMDERLHSIRTDLTARDISSVAFVFGKMRRTAIMDFTFLVMDPPLFMSDALTGYSFMTAHQDRYLVFVDRQSLHRYTGQAGCFEAVCAYLTGWREKYFKLMTRLACSVLLDDMSGGRKAGFAERCAATILLCREYFYFEGFLGPMLMDKHISKPQGMGIPEILASRFGTVETFLKEGGGSAAAEKMERDFHRDLETEMDKALPELEAMTMDSPAGPVANAGEGLLIAVLKDLMDWREWKKDWKWGNRNKPR